MMEVIGTLADGPAHTVVGMYDPDSYGYGEMVQLAAFTVHGKGRESITKAIEAAQELYNKAMEANDDDTINNGPTVHPDFLTDDLVIFPGRHTDIRE